MAFDTASRPICVLAPMVRTGELPTRLMALKYGADLVWGPEVVDRAIIGTTRTLNTSISCIDFTKSQAHREADTSKVIFRTHAELERGKLIFQLGTSSPTLAVEAALQVARDIAGIDVNAGCPKHFSIHSGMGAALLKTPDKLCEILTSLVKAVGPATEYGVPISVKIRLLEPYTETFGLVDRLVKTGIKRLTVHMRTTPMRPREAAIRQPEIIQGIVRICQENGVETLLNGDVSCRSDAQNLAASYGLDGCMIARAAEANASCFIGSKEDMLPFAQIAREYLQTAMEVDNHFSNTKFCLSHIIEGKSELYSLVTRSKAYKEICQHLKVNHVAGLSSDEGTAKTEAVKKAKEGGNASAKAADCGHSSGAGKRKKNKNIRGVVSATTIATPIKPENQLTIPDIGASVLDGLTTSASNFV